MSKAQQKYIIGIDTGVSTGFAVWSVADQKLLELSTVNIAQALKKIINYSIHGDVFVRIEDARKFFSKGANKFFNPAKAQGAGSIKAESRIWEMFMTEWKIPHEMVSLNATQKGKNIDAATFNKSVGWNGSSSKHSRDAAMLVYKYNRR